MTSWFLKLVYCWYRFFLSNDWMSYSVLSYTASFLQLIFPVLTKNIKSYFTVLIQLYI